MVDEGESLTVSEGTITKTNSSSGACTTVQIKPDCKYHFAVKGSSQGAEAVLWVRIPGGDDIVYDAKYKLPLQDQGPAWQSELLIGQN